MKKAFILSLILFLQASSIFCRNFRRPTDLTSASITITSSNTADSQQWISRKTRSHMRTKDSYTLKSPFLRYEPLRKGFDTTFFNDHYLPQNQSIDFRNNKGKVSTEILDQLANEFIEEVKVGQQTFTNFTILKDKDFNYKNLSGLLVAKFKDYPFVLKLSIEHPHTIIKPFAKSFEATSIFIIGGNIRHLSNFTRITNLEKIKHMLSYNNYYLENISFPRKWYWKPKNTYNLNITWNESAYRKKEEFSIPSSYAVISDYIETDPTYPQQELNKISMKIASDTCFLIDPHAGNCVKDKDKNKFTLLDTEDFRNMVGLEGSIKAKKYIGWYIEMTSNGFKTYCCRNKKERIRHTFGV